MKKIFIFILFFNFLFISEGSVLYCIESEQKYSILQNSLAPETTKDPKHDTYFVYETMLFPLTNIHFKDLQKQVKVILLKTGISDNFIEMIREKENKERTKVFANIFYLSYYLNTDDIALIWEDVLTLNLHKPFLECFRVRI